MNANLTELVCIIDKSGSMGAIQSDAIGGFNSFLAAQKKEPGDTRFTLVLFDTQFETPYHGVPIKDVVPLDETSYVPGGCTALLDATGQTIRGIGKRLEKTPEADRPGKVIVAILTDGEENSSRHFNQQQVLDMITHQQAKYNWEFVFLAANQDAIATGASIGIQAADSVAFSATPDGISAAYCLMDQAVSKKRRVSRAKTDATSTGSGM